MSVFQNLHMHSTWDDGQASAEEMIRASREAGLTSVGVSLHSPMPWAGCTWCPTADRLPDYLEDIHALQKKFEGSIRVYTGIEWDARSEVELTPFDYVIGSVHHLPLTDYPMVDESVEMMEGILREAGDPDTVAEMYFAEYDRIVGCKAVDIVGHFDLLTKFDEQRHFFDENSPRYRRAAEQAMEKLVRVDKIFEVNTGAISRGYRTTPYPSMQWLNLLHEMGGRVTISADAHHPSGVTCGFDLAQERLRQAGFKEIWNLTNAKEFVPISF